MTNVTDLYESMGLHTSAERPTQNFSPQLYDRQKQQNTQKRVEPMREQKIYQEEPDYDESYSGNEDYDEDDYAEEIEYPEETESDEEEESFEPATDNSSYVEPSQSSNHSLIGISNLNRDMIGLNNGLITTRNIDDTKGRDIIFGNEMFKDFNAKQSNGLQFSDSMFRIKDSKNNSKSAGSLFGFESLKTNSSESMFGFKNFKSNSSDSVFAVRGLESSLFGFDDEKNEDVPTELNGAFMDKLKSIGSKVKSTVTTRFVTPIQNRIIRRKPVEAKEPKASGFTPKPLVFIPEDKQPVNTTVQPKSAPTEKELEKVIEIGRLVSESKKEEAEKERQEKEEEREKYLTEQERLKELFDEQEANKLKPKKQGKLGRIIGILKENRNKPPTDESGSAEKQSDFPKKDEVKIDKPKATPIPKDVANPPENDPVTSSDPVPDGGVVTSVPEDKPKKSSRIEKVISAINNINEVNKNTSSDDFFSIDKSKTPSNKSDKPKSPLAYNGMEIFPTYKGSDKTNKSDSILSGFGGMEVYPTFKSSEGNKSDSILSGFRGLDVFPAFKSAPVSEGKPIQSGSNAVGFGGMEVYPRFNQSNDSKAGFGGMEVYPRFNQDNSNGGFGLGLGGINILGGMVEKSSDSKSQLKATGGGYSLAETLGLGIFQASPVQKTFPQAPQTENVVIPAKPVKKQKKSKKTTTKTSVEAYTKTAKKTVKPTKTKKTVKTTSKTPVLKI